MSNKSSPVEPSSVNICSNNNRGSVSTEESLLPRDFSLVSITSSASQDEYFKSRDHAESTLKRMQNYLDSQQLCDVVLIAGMDGKR